MKVVTVGILFSMLPIAADAGSLFGWLLPSYDDHFMSACDEVIRDRLKDPSSYRRTSETDVEKSEATLDDYFGWGNPEKKSEDLALQERNEKAREIHEDLERSFHTADFTLVSSLITYEAQNSFGGPVQNIVKCTIVTANAEDWKDYDAGMVMIDGFTIDGWHRHRIMQLSQ